MNNFKKIPVGRAKDLTGKKYNLLTVLYRTQNQRSSTQWVCQCDCGNIVKVSASNLTKEHTKSCGCLKLTNNPINIGDVFGELTIINKKDNNKWICECSCGNIVTLSTQELHKNRKQCGLNHKTDLTNQKFGRLTVLRLTDQKTKNRGLIWECQCDCGNITNVPGYSLKNGTVQSCGCLRLERLREATREDLTGKIFGRWKVLKVSDFYNNGAYWICECQCPNKTIRTVAASSLKNGRSQSCGCIKSKGEEKIATILTENNIFFEREKTFSNLILPTGKKARFDFYVNNQYLIEYDGEQHFKIGGWCKEEDFTKIKKYDKIKDEWCKENNIPLIRIPYTKYNSLTINDLILEEK